MNFEEFKSYIRTHSDEEVVQFLLFDEIPYCFQNNLGLYKEFRSVICNNLSIHPQNFSIIGSAKIGFSLNVHKNIGKQFDESSDIDIVLVSNEMFERIWYKLLEFRKMIVYKLDEKAKQRFMELQKIMFYGRIRMDKLSNQFDYAKKWWEIFNLLSIEKKYGPRLVRAALFKTWKHVSDYYENGISQIRRKI
jgi:hypothetical protein